MRSFTIKSAMVGKLIRDEIPGVKMVQNTLSRVFVGTGCIMPVENFGYVIIRLRSGSLWTATLWPKAWPNSYEIGDLYFTEINNPFGGIIINGN